MHAVLDRLYRERPGGDPLPRPGSLGAWIGRARELAGEVAAERDLGAHPAERAIARRVEGLLARFLADEAGRETGGYRALAAGGDLRRGRGGRAPGARDRRLGPARGDRPGRPRARRQRAGPRLQALPRGHPAREVRGAGEAAAAALPDRGRRALGRRRGRRPLPPAARERPRGARAGPCSRKPRRGSPPTASTTTTWSTARASRRCSPTPADAPARSSPACAPARSAATPARAAACAATTSAPPSATSRRSAAATGRRPSRG